MNYMLAWIKKHLPQFFVVGIFALAFIVMAPFVAKLHFYIDDFSYALDKPSLLHNFSAFFSNYTLVHGIYRPLALIYYYFVYSLYFINSSATHLIPLFIHVLAGYFLYRILHKQGLMHSLSLLAGLLYVLHPFATEQYMWLSAGPGTLVNLLFLMQLGVIYHPHTNHKTKLILIFIISCISVFLYESIFFFFIPLTYLYMKTVPHTTRKKALKVLMLLGIPAFIYGATKILIKGTEPRPLVDSIPLLLDHIRQTFGYLYKVHLWNYYPSNFWTVYRDQGWNILAQSNMLQAFVFLFLVTIIVGLFLKKDHKKEAISHPFNFWLLTFEVSLIPLVANKEFYFGFRTLFLPVILLIICFLWVAQKLLGKNALLALLILGVFFIGWFILVDFNIADKYETFYQSDMILAQKINTALTTQGLNTQKNSVFVYLQNDNPPDSRHTFLHGDHILSCFFYNWSSYSCMKSVTDSIAALGIKQSNGHFTLQNWISTGDFFQRKPFIQLRYKINKELIIEKVVNN